MMGHRAWGMGHAVAALFATAAIAGVSRAQTIAITGGRVHPVSGPVIENGTVIIRNGRIAAVGANVTIPPDATRIDATGKWVTPGIVNVATTLGVVEIGAVQETNDTPARGRGDAITASHKVWEGFNANSPLIQVMNQRAADYGTLNGKDSWEHPSADAANGVTGTETITWQLRRI